MFHSTFGGPTRLAGPFSLYCLIPPSSTKITTLTPNKHLLSPTSAARIPTFNLKCFFFFCHSDATGVIPTQSPIPEPLFLSHLSPLQPPLALARAQPRPRSARPGHGVEAAQGRAAAAARAPSPRAPLPAASPRRPAPSLTHPPPAVPRPPALSMPGPAVAMAPPRGAAWRRNPLPPPRPARTAGAAHARQGRQQPPEGGAGPRGPSGPSSSSGGRLAAAELAALSPAEPRVPPHHNVSAAQLAPLPQVLQDARPLPPGDPDAVLLLRGVRDQHRCRLPWPAERSACGQLPCWLPAGR